MLAAVAAHGRLVATAVQPFARPQLPTKAVWQCDLRALAEKSPQGHDCALHYAGNSLEISSTGSDPFIELPAFETILPRRLLLRLRGRFRSGGAGRIYWRSQRDPAWSEQQAIGFSLLHDGKLHDYEIPLELDSNLLQLRLDPGEAAGSATITRLELVPLRLHPLEVLSVQTNADHIALEVQNHEPAPLNVHCLGRTWKLPGDSVRRLDVEARGDRPFECLTLEIAAEALPPVRRHVVLIRPGASALWHHLGRDGLELDVAKDGSGARILHDGRVVGYLAPLVQCKGKPPALELAEASGRRATFRGEKTSVRIGLEEDEVEVRIESDLPCEGPVVRPLGELEQGLFAGLEYLGKGEQSSSTLDIETPEHWRFAPNRLQVTMPLAVCRTTEATFALTWSDMNLQPRYAVPNFLDGAAGQRMSLEGRRIGAVLRVDRASLETAIVRAATAHALPKLPPAPRSPAKQQALCLAALEGPLRGEGGWGHCAEPNWGRAPYADMASTLFYLTGRVPQLKELVPNGSHLRNDIAYFLTGRVAQWRQLRAAETEAVRAEQRADGSFRYDGPLRRGHFEDTASGFEAQRAVVLLEWAQLSGDGQVREAGMKSLEHLRRFRTPRGAQTWEVPLHTPDVLASAWLVRAYLRGYELCGRSDYLELARKWAISGIPFVYQWSARPIMPYATISVLGATNWRAPNWIGLPVQWCGIVYADAVAQLAAHDQTFAWRQLAEGVLRAAEQMQYPEGLYAGCLPDSFDLAGQERRGPAINPCTLVYLRRRLEGKPVGLSCASDARHRVVAPFAVTIDGAKAVVQAEAGLRYQVLIDGQRIVSVDSQGTDLIALDAVESPQ
jgi:hypothetical protein